jgi:hypothetical protein
MPFSSMWQAALRMEAATAPMAFLAPLDKAERKLSADGESSGFVVVLSGSPDENRRIRFLHSGGLPDVLSYLEADLSALKARRATQ